MGLLLTFFAELLLFEALLLLKMLFPVFVFAVCVFEAELVFLVKMLFETVFELELLLKILPAETTVLF